MREPRPFAASTTQGPADRIGQGNKPSLGPRFSHSTNAWFPPEVEWNLHPPLPKMLVLDFVDTSRCGGAMDDDTRELIKLLATRVGMLMEDCSIKALTCGSQNASDIAAALDDLENCAASILALIGAAKALLP